MLPYVMYYNSFIHFCSILTTLKTPFGQITEEEKILQEEKRFYEKLYSENDKDINCRQAGKSFLHTVEIPKISCDKKLLCGQEINENECKKALLELKNNKTPVCDGLPVEFYKFFWNKVKFLILDSFHWSFKNKQLSLDQKRGIINLVPKTWKRLMPTEKLAPY